MSETKLGPVIAAQDHAVTQLVEDHSEDQKGTKKHHLHVGVDLREVHAVLDKNNEEGP